MHYAYVGATDGVGPKALESLAPVLLAVLQRRHPLRLAATCALVWLNGGWSRSAELGTRRAWIPTPSELQILLHVLESAGDQDYFLKNCLVTLWGAARYQAAGPAIAREITAARGITGTHELRVAAAIALGRMRDGSAVEPLIAALTDPSSYVRMEVLTSLGGLRDPGALDSILVYLRDSEAAVRRAAIEALITSGDPKSPRNPVAPSDPDTPIHGSSMEKTVLEKAAAPLLDTLINDESEQVRVIAGVTLARLGSSRAVEVLTQRLTHPDPSVRRHAPATPPLQPPLACDLRHPRHPRRFSKKKSHPPPHEEQQTTPHLPRRLLTVHNGSFPPPEDSNPTPIIATVLLHCS